MFTAIAFPVCSLPGNEEYLKLITCFYQTGRKQKELDTALSKRGHRLGRPL